MNTSGGLYYGSYLQLDSILNAQVRESEKAGRPAHDEMLFIIVHQAFELWFKQILHEVADVIRILGQDYVPEAGVGTCLDRIIRVNKILAMMPEQFSILETMTPRGFMEFRDYLYPASGFQSWQFRLFEISLGVSEARRLHLDKSGYASRLAPEHQAEVQRAQEQDSLFDVVERWLEKMPFMEMGGYAFWTEYRNAVSAIFRHDREELKKVTSLTQEQVDMQDRQIAALENNFEALFDAERFEALRAEGTKRLSQRATLAALFISVYSEYPLLQTPFRLLDAILETDKLVSVFRFRHSTMVSRMIGQRTGTGGSSGADYLMKTVTQHRVFTDIAALSSYLVAPDHVPALPSEIKARLQFASEM
ncbi:MAG: tryptophan 2,3-dioxygenase family protein [Candidatus Kapaibacterium sp.]|jgi:tryptophan 2,3-dioxygenase